MALEDYKCDIEMCNRCSLCKFIPMEKVKGAQYVNDCPSIARYNFHAYSGGGRLNIAMAMLEDRLGGKLEFDDKLIEVVYDCQMCGACDISCKYGMDMEVLEPINELRTYCVEEGHTLPALDSIINSMRKQGTMVPGAKAKRGKWAEGLNVKDATKKKAKVVYHAGCRVCYDKEMWKVAQATVKLLQKAGIDIGITGEHEVCCGSRAYQTGYRRDFIHQGQTMTELIKKTGAEILVTGCADCYYAFKVLYHKFDMKGEFEVMHTTEYLARLIKEAKLKPNKKVVAKVTYHDPCHLGRLGEPYIPWQGKEVPGHIRIFDPPKELRRGTHGVYEPPRDILKSISGLELVEMDRIKEYAWCCGSGGGVGETNPEFARWTARERIEEAESIGAEAIVTACPGCEQLFSESIKDIDSHLKVYDVVELLKKAI